MARLAMEQACFPSGPSTAPHLQHRPALLRPEPSVLARAPPAGPHSPCRSCREQAALQGRRTPGRSRCAPRRAGDRPRRSSAPGDCYRSWTIPPGRAAGIPGDNPHWRWRCRWPGSCPPFEALQHVQHLRDLADLIRLAMGEIDVDIYPSGTGGGYPPGPAAGNPA